MKQSFDYLLNTYGQDYATWPAYAKRMLWCIVEHYIHHDNKNFEFLVKALKKIIDKDSNCRARIPVEVEEYELDSADERVPEQQTKEPLDVLLEVFKNMGDAFHQTL